MGVWGRLVLPDVAPRGEGDKLGVRERLLGQLVGVAPHVPLAVALRLHVGLMRQLHRVGIGTR